MSRIPPGIVRGTSLGGVAGSHPDVPPLPVLAAPATGNEKNTIRASVVPMACWRMEDLRFDFASSVLLPDTREDFPLLADLIDEHTVPRPAPGQAHDPGALVPPATIFGHTDPVGDDDFNKRLSGRRAAAVYGALTRRNEVWEDLYSNKGKFALPASGDTWGIRSIQIMLNALPADPAPDSAKQGGGGGASGSDRDADGFPKGLDPTEDLGPQPDDPPDGDKDKKLLDEPLEVTGELDPPTREAVKRFQASARGRAAGLAVDGDPGPKTRSALFLAYMDVVCVDSGGDPFKVDREKGFLGRGRDEAGKCDFQGCSEFNPVMVFSRSEQAAFDAQKDKTARNAENSVNRRVLVLLFRPGLNVSGFWPCPRATEGTAACKKRFWSDGEKRRSQSDTRREFADTHDTFACRFYQRMTTSSPCERSLSEDRVLLRMQIHDAFYEPCRDERFTATGDGGFFERGRTDGNGMLAIKVPRNLRKIAIRYTPKELKTTYEVTAEIVAPDRTDDPARLSHLRNFGFGTGDDKPSEVVVKFQAARADLDLTGALDNPTRAAIDELMAGELKPGLGADRG